LLMRISTGPQANRPNANSAGNDRWNRFMVLPLVRVEAPSVQGGAPRGRGHQTDLFASH
jgi:hypothetical protein